MSLSLSLASFSLSPFSPSSTASHPLPLLLFGISPLPPPFFPLLPLRATLTSPLPPRPFLRTQRRTVLLNALFVALVQALHHAHHAERAAGANARAWREHQLPHLQRRRR
eukprot:4122885-Pleurochrysis_carterae.AAC.1